MENELEQCDLRTLLEAYMMESREFSTALQAGASWQTLKDRRDRIRHISSIINKKYDELYSSQRRRHNPPHGD